MILQMISSDAHGYVLLSLVTTCLFAFISIAARGDEKLRAEIASTILAVTLSVLPDLPIPYVCTIMVTYYALDICYSSRLTRDFVLHHIFTSICSLCFGSKFPVAFRAYIRLEESTVTINAYHLSKRVKLPKFVDTAMLLVLIVHFAESRIYTLFFTTDPIPEHDWLDRRRSRMRQRRHLYWIDQRGEPEESRHHLV